MTHQQPDFALRWVIFTAVMFFTGMFLFLVMIPKHSLVNVAGVGFMIFVGASLAAYIVDKLFPRKF